MKLPPLNPQIKINPFLKNFSTVTIYKMIEDHRRILTEKKVEQKTRAEVRFTLLELQEILSQRLHACEENDTDTNLWAAQVGTQVLIRPTEEMGSITGDCDALCIDVEWGQDGQLNSFYPSELEIRVPSYIWQVPT